VGEPSKFEIGFDSESEAFHTPFGKLQYVRMLSTVNSGQIFNVGNLGMPSM